MLSTELHVLRFCCCCFRFCRHTAWRTTPLRQGSWHMATSQNDSVQVTLWPTSGIFFLVHMHPGRRRLCQVRSVCNCRCFCWSLWESTETDFLHTHWGLMFTWHLEFLLRFYSSKMTSQNIIGTDGVCSLGPTRVVFTSCRGIACQHGTVLN